MTNLKVLLLVALSWLSCSLYNPAYAENNTNPWDGTEYTDLKDLAQWWLDQGGSIDSYLYSEGFSTGIDGVLGNENICIRDDTKRVYIGRSDVCVDRQMDKTYSYIQIDKMDWSNGFPELTVLQTGDLIGDTAEYWQGCFNVTTGEQWGGDSGGQCPNISLSYGGQINYGYIQQVLTNTAAINLALQEQGIEVTGYTYSWYVKNADANYEDSNGAGGQDPFSVTIKIKDSSGNTVYEKTYDYSYWIDNWTKFSGEETFKNPLEGTNLSELELSISGRDAGFWAGYYGPEFREPSVKLNYRVTSIAKDTTIEDLLFNQQCATDPLSNILCDGYQQAMLDKINASSNASSLVENNPQPQQQVVEVQEIVPEIAPEIKENNPKEESVVETSTEASPEKSAAATGLSANQSLALNIASEATKAAESISSDQATQSASIGLSESGGVSSSLTADGVSNPNGTLSTDLTSNMSNDNSSNGNEMQSGGQIENGSGSTLETNIDNTLQNTPENSMTMTENSMTGNDIQDGSNSQELNQSTGESDTVQLDDNTEVDIFNNTEIADQNVQQNNKVFTVDLTDLNNPITQIINAVTEKVIQDAVAIAEEIAEESAEENYDEQNAKEDNLVEKALAGDDNEDAQAALLGYNPKFRAYQSPQMPDSQFYQPKEIYGTQKNYDNPNGRLFNGASDKIHREMVRSQYDR